MESVRKPATSCRGSTAIEPDGGRRGGEGRGRRSRAGPPQCPDKGAQSVSETARPAPALVNGVDRRHARALDRCLVLAWQWHRAGADLWGILENIQLFFISKVNLLQLIYGHGYFGLDKALMNIQLLDPSSATAPTMTDPRIRLSFVNNILCVRTWYTNTLFSVFSQPQPLRCCFQVMLRNI
jgi:hypothetical protein